MINKLLLIDALTTHRSKRYKKKNFIFQRPKTHCFSFQLKLKIYYLHNTTHPYYDRSISSLNYFYQINVMIYL